jgi:cyclopropane fatty-acyl-phospholipid synthase-like methyltransferase
MLCSAAGAQVLFEKMGRNIVRCDGCRPEWVDPMPSAAELAAYYEASYADGAYSFFAEAREERRGIARYRFERISSFTREGRWLDVGASAGDFVEVASEKHDAEGLELSETAVREARGRGLRMHCAAVEDFSPESPYAMITAFDVLEHLREPRAFLQSLRGWLRADGRLVLTLPDVSSFYPRWLMGRHWFYYVPSEHLFYYDPASVTRLLEEEGFRVESVHRAYKTLSLRYAANNLRHFNA